MTTPQQVGLGFLFFGTACELVCVAGVLWFRDAFDQLHFAGASSTVGMLALAVAVVLTGFSSPSGTIECVTAVLLVFCLNPVLVAATGRAARRVRGGDLSPSRAEYRRQP